ncbi:Cystatin-related plant [Arabidopsis suecica]|uniref:Cystatin-related plant n=1 Tax=Arabidopsis suecica TaxID=45249 RepID=A0A8T2EAN0_ARASU|nr:Cystatin-related plant [Arabidopsis suecica]
MVLNQCANVTMIEENLSKLMEEIESVEADESEDTSDDEEAKTDVHEANFDMLMAPEWDVHSFEEKTMIKDSMEASSSVVVSSCLKKRKAEFDPEDEEESNGEREEGSDGKAKIEEPKAKTDYYFKVPEWDVDSFDALKPTDHYKGFRPMNLEWEAIRGIKNFREYWEEMVYVVSKNLTKTRFDLNVELVEVVRGYYRGGPKSKSYITFMVRKKPDGPLGEYQAKCMVTLHRKRHPILCRPTPTPKP